jgi:hypothetical protein
MFFESAFGVCVGCKMYHFFTHKKAKLCPGGACEYHPKQIIQEIHSSQVIALLGFILIIVAIMQIDGFTKIPLEPCEVPEWAQNMGHEEMYRIHHGCK